MGNNQSYFGGDNRPIEQVSWEDVQLFLKRLNQLTGKQYRLPTEAEWEYAARGGQKTNAYLYAGSNDIGTVASYIGNNDYGHIIKTDPVATKAPNELGLYDMSGNVWEWCNDWYGSDYYASSPDTNPTGFTNGTHRVNRGGSCHDPAKECRSTNRNNNSPDFRDPFLGFRLVHPK